jgi:hypothetical protein
MGDELGRLSCVQLATVKHTNPSAALTAQGFALISTVSAAVSGSQGSAANFASICERVAQGWVPVGGRGEGAWFVCEVIAVEGYDPRGMPNTTGSRVCAPSSSRS